MAITRQGITLRWLLGFLVLLLLLNWILVWSEATLKVDRLLHDSWVRALQRTPPDEIVIAAINPESLQVLGRWPWPRERQALLYNKLAEYGVKAVVIDVLYTEASAEPANDLRLADAIEELPVVILPVLTEGRVGPGIQEKLPLPMLTRQVSDLGHIHMPIDDDGIVRRLYLKGGFNQAHWPALALAAYTQLYTNPPQVLENLPGRRTEQLNRPNQWVQDYEVLIPFYGPTGTFATVSAAEIINGKAPRAALQNKVVFVGLTSTGLGDVVPTPVSALDQPIPGVEIHATLFAGLLDRSLVTRVDSRLSTVVALALLPLMLLVYSRARPQWGLVIAVAGSLVPIFISYFLYSTAQRWFPPLAASVPILVSYLLWSWHRLSFLNRFIERETAMLEPHLTDRDSSDNLLLADFFTNAAKHLPIEGWKFSAKGQQFQGGNSLPKILPGNISEHWISRRDVYSRRYPTLGRLEIQLAITDTTIADELTRYIDTLARVQSRTEPTRWSDSIERLQINTAKLSEQMAWLRGIKVFSESIFDGSPAGFIVWNAAGEQVRANQLAYDLLPNQVDNPVLIDFVHAIGSELDRTRDHARMQSLILRRRSWQITHVEGETEIVVNFTALGDSLAERLICASIIDVSKIRTAERSRAEMVDYLSHDLRSPLISALYLLEDATPGQKASTDQTERVEQNIRRSLQMMDDLLHVARADNLAAENFAELLFNAVIDNALDQLAPQAKSRCVSIDVDSDDEDLWMDGDAASLERAVVNIIGNAIKYSAEGGRISVVTKRFADQAVLTVADDGVGIDPAMMGELFTRFKRDARVAARFQGIGLGLALVARVVKQHAGEVSAESPGKGTRIVMRLPLKVLVDDE